MKITFATATVMALLAMVPGVSLAATSGGMHATKGVVEFVDANKLVIKQPPQYGPERMFVLNPTTERVGTVKVGSTVDIRYRTEAKLRVATAITVVHAKTTPSTTGSQQ